MIYIIGYGLFLFWEVFMKTIKNNLESEAVYSDDKTKRYSLYLEWDKNLKRACIIMLKAGSTDGISFDKTTNLVLQNLSSIGYGGVDILNLFPSKDSDFDDSDTDNSKIIDASCKCTDTVIYAVGTGHKSNKKVQKKQDEILDIISKYSDKLYCISDDDGKKFYHPLCPKVQKWNIT